MSELTSANRGPNSRFVLEAIIKALIFKSSRRLKIYSGSNTKAKRGNSSLNTESNTGGERKKMADY